jgi:hypothetical protein
VFLAVDASEAMKVEKEAIAKTAAADAVAEADEGDAKEEVMDDAALAAISSAGDEARSTSRVAFAFFADAESGKFVGLSADLVYTLKVYRKSPSFCDDGEGSDRAARFARARKLDLSGGRGGESGNTVYKAPDGTVVTSSSATYTNTNFYYIQYLFDSVTNAASCHTHYWLSDTSSSAGSAQSLLIEFPKHVYLMFMHVFPSTHCNAAKGDRRSDYKIEVWDIAVNDWVSITDRVIDTQSSKLGKEIRHDVDKKVRKVRLWLYQKGKYGNCLNEIDFYVLE